MSALHDSDFIKWCEEQSAVLRTGCIEGLDFKNLAEEIDFMSGSIRSELESRLIVLVCHLLKWKYQPDYRGNSWKYTIEEQEERIERLVDRNPSLKYFYKESLEIAFSCGRKRAAAETKIAIEAFPEKFDLQEALKNFKEGI